MYTLGKVKSLDEITGKDVMENKIWLWVWEANLEEEYPEDYQVPVLGIDNIDNSFAEPIITLYVQGYEDKMIASASYDAEKDMLFAISIWFKGEWHTIQNATFLIDPITFISSVKINNIEGRQFVCEAKLKDKALAKE